MRESGVKPKQTKYASCNHPTLSGLGWLCNGNNTVAQSDVMKVEETMCQIKIYAKQLELIIIVIWTEEQIKTLIEVAVTIKEK